MASKIFSYFNGSRYYRLKFKLEREYFAGAQKIVRSYKLILPLYEKAVTYAPSAQELNEYHTNKERFLSILKQKHLSHTTGIISFNGSQFIITQFGLDTFTKAKASIDARLATSYVMDLFPKRKVSEFLTKLSAALALSWLNPGAFGAACVWVLKEIYDMINYIIQRLNERKITGLNHKTYAMQTSSNYYNRQLESKLDKQSGKMSIFQGYEAYANGSLYKRHSASSERFSPTRVYNPSFAFANDNKQSAYEGLDNQTQNRAHYDLGGNEGFNAKINPQMPLDSITELNPDIEYKQNWLNNENARILEGYGLLGAYLATSEKQDASGNFYTYAHVGEWLQIVYESDYDVFAEQYEVYVQSKDVINRAHDYNKALRAKGLFYSKKHNKNAQNVFLKSIPVSSFAPPALPQDDFSQSSPKDDFENLVMFRALEKLTDKNEQEKWEIIEACGEQWQQAYVEILNGESVRAYFNALSPAEYVQMGIFKDFHFEKMLWVIEKYDKFEGIYHQYEIRYVNRAHFSYETKSFNDFSAFFIYFLSFYIRKVPQIQGDSQTGAMLYMHYQTLGKYITFISQSGQVAFTTPHLHGHESAGQRAFLLTLQKVRDTLAFCKTKGLESYIKNAALVLN